MGYDILYPDKFIFYWLYFNSFSESYISNLFLLSLMVIFSYSYEVPFLAFHNAFERTENSLPNWTIMFESVSCKDPIR